MHIVEKEYSKDFIQQCRVEFGLEPKQIRKIIAVLSVNNALDVESLLRNMDKLKSAVHEGSVLVDQMSKDSCGMQRLGGF